MPRKTILRRFGAVSKGLPRLLKPPQLVANKVSQANDAINETIELYKGAAMNITKPVIELDAAAMDRSLTRSNTFVCDTVDVSQAKLLSITHNVNAPAANETVLVSKERSSKRSLSPIPGELMNAAKRKLMQLANQKPVAIQNSTPRRSISYSDARKANLTFLGSKSPNFNDPQVEQMQTFTLDGSAMEQTKNFAPDAAKLGSASSSAMQANRVFDLTQTVEQHDAFYPDNRHATQTLDANAAEHELKNSDATINDGNLRKTITGKFNCASL